MCLQVSRNEKQWKQWFDKELPEEEIIPDGYNNSLDVFRRLLLVRCWCPDRTIAQARKYIADTLGDKYAEGVILDLEQMWEESDNRTPLVGLLSMGSDPTSSIEGLAKKIKLCKCTHRIFYLSLRSLFISQGEIFTSLTLLLSNSFCMKHLKTILCRVLLVWVHTERKFKCLYSGIPTERIKSIVIMKRNTTRKL